MATNDGFSGGFGIITLGLLVSVGFVGISGFELVLLVLTSYINFSGGDQ